jgi:serine/threonine-protein kinase
MARASAGGEPAALESTEGAAGRESAAGESRAGASATGRESTESAAGGASKAGEPARGSSGAASSAMSFVPPAASPEPAAARRREPAGLGRLHVNLVPWAEASVDGRELGRTPISVELPPGKHTLVLVNPDLGQRRARQISIVRDADTRITEW